MGRWKVLFSIQNWTFFTNENDPGYPPVARPWKFKHFETLKLCSGCARGVRGYARKVCELYAQEVSARYTRPWFFRYTRTFFLRFRFAVSQNCIWYLEI